MKHCNYCGREMADNASFCTSCGRQVEKPSRVCPYCAETVPADATVCPCCHTPLAQSDEQNRTQARHESGYSQVTEPAFEAVQEPKRRKGHGLLIGIIIGLLIAGAGVAVYLFVPVNKEIAAAAADVDTVRQDTVADVGEPTDMTETGEEIYEESYEEFPDETDISGYPDLHALNARGTIDGTPYRLEGEWNSDGTLSGTYVNEYINARLSFRGREVDGVLEIRLGSKAGTLTLENDGSGNYEGFFTKGSTCKPATLSVGYN